MTSFNAILVDARLNEQSFPRVMLACFPKALPKPVAGQPAPVAPAPAEPAEFDVSDEVWSVQLPGLRRGQRVRVTVERVDFRIVPGKFDAATKKTSPSRCLTFVRIGAIEALADRAEGGLAPEPAKVAPGGLGGSKPGSKGVAASD